MYQFKSILDFIADSVYVSLWIYSVIVFVAVIISWIPVDPHHPTAIAVLRFLRRATEPTFYFFRKTLRLGRYTGPIDITPVVVLFLIVFLQVFLVQTIRDLVSIGYPVRFAMYLISNFFLGLLNTLSVALRWYMWIVIFAFLVSWFVVRPLHPLAQAFVRFFAIVTEPVFEFLRRTFRYYRYIRSIDYISPLIVVVAIFFLRNTVILALMQQVLMLRRPF